MSERSEFKPNHESENVFQVDPTELMQDNPAALIVNKESYQRMEAHFAPEKLDPPQVVRVSTYSPEHGEVTKLFVVDGMTRTKFASDHKGEKVEGHPQFNFDTIQVRDVTTSIKRNPQIVPLEERDDTENSITMLQYLRAVVPPTAEHSHIASDRIAAHLINGWENMVGEDIAERFSALAAISYLTQGTINENILRDRMKRQKELMVGEKMEERVMLEQKLLEMSSIIREAKLMQQEVARSAFMLVSAGSPVIGGERRALQQVYGMLHTPEVQMKLLSTVSQPGERERLRQELGKTLAASLSRFSDSPDKQLIFSTVGEALRDKSLNFDQIHQVLEADSPVEKYTQVREGINIEKLEKAYRSSRSGGLHQTESELISTLGKRTSLNDNELPGLIGSIRNAQYTIEQADNLKQWLLADRERLQEEGVALNDIMSAVGRINRLQVDLITSSSRGVLSRKAQDLNATLAGIEESITRKTNEHKVGEAVNDVYGDEAESGFGPIIKTNIVDYVLREVDTVSDDAVRAKIQELNSLDQDLQVQVIRGDMRMSYAAKLQKERGGGRDRSARTVRISSLESSQRVQEPEEQVLLDKREIEEHRKKVNNERLTQAARALRAEVASLDLDADEITAATKKEIDSTLRVLGKLRFEHPDIVRAVEEYKKQIQQDIELAKVRIRQEQEDASRDTRTGH